jgi:alcohol dehydrogenase (cytochrome c)
MSPSASAARAALILVLPAMLGAQSVGGVSFTKAQADQGRQVYTRSCGACHGQQLTDGSAMPVAGPQFREKWSSPTRSLDELFTLIRTTMPSGGARSLTDDQYLAVTAYLLESNGISAGAGPLTADRAILANARLSWAGGTVATAAVGAPASATPWNVKRVVPDYQEGPRGRAPKAAGPTQADLLAADKNPSDWLTHTRDLAGTRYSPLNQIDTRNVSRLKVACSFQVGEQGGFQTGPIVYRGTLFLTTGWATMAIDAATCRGKWRHDWTHALPGNPTYRGVAIKDGRVVRGTADGYLLALDADDGTLLWSRRIADANIGERITMPPIIHDDLILIGPAGSENAIKGWVGAFRLDNGERVWRFNIVPEPGESGYETWKMNPGFPVGGGGVWTPASIDAQRGLLHVAATNPAPDFPATLRGGTNLYTNSALALNLKTGKLAWYEQMVPEDDHDWDLTQVAPLYRATIAGQQRDLMSTVGKDGILRVIDRETRKRLFETPVTTIENVDAPVTNKGTHACPGVLGGVEWSGPAYHPGVNVLVVPAVDWCGTYSVSDTIRFVPGQNYLGGDVQLDSASQGWVTAVDAVSGKVRWRYRSPRPMVGAVTATAGGLIFAGELTGDLIALDAATGNVLFRHNTGGSVGGGIVSYDVGGTQYIAVASGRPSGLRIDQFPGAATNTRITLDRGN